tara:strand:+ start:295 stop:501 length:207 start_codon:yes stop_codon:yes gene_type:complete
MTDHNLLDKLTNIWSISINMNNLEDIPLNRYNKVSYIRLKFTIQSFLCLASLENKKNYLHNGIGVLNE